jgi:hypothetical protein
LSDSDSDDLDSSKLSSTNYSPVFSEDNTSGSSNRGKPNDFQSYDQGIECVTLPDSDESNTENSQVLRKINLKNPQSFECDDRRSPSSFNFPSSPTGFRSLSPKNFSELGFLSPKQTEETSFRHSFSATETSDQRDSQSCAQTPLTSYLPVQSTPSFHSVNPTIIQTEDLITPVPRKHVRFARQQYSSMSTPSSRDQSFSSLTPDNNETETIFQQHILSTPMQTKDATDMSSAGHSPLQPDHEFSLPEISRESQKLQVPVEIVINKRSSQDLIESESQELNPVMNLSTDQSVRTISSELPSVDRSNNSALHSTPLKAKKSPRIKKALRSLHYPCHCRVRTVVRKIKIRDAATQTSP